MSNNTEWAELGNHFGHQFLAPGEFEDNNGSTNEQHVLVVDGCAIQGTPDEWVTLAHELLTHFGAEAVEDERDEVAPAVLVPVHDYLYSCAFCGFGADDEEGMDAHYDREHPNGE